MVNPAFANLDAKMKELQAEAKALINDEVKSFFEKYPLIDRISYLDQSTYNDEGYEHPGNELYNWGYGSSVVLVDDFGDYDDPASDSDEPVTEEYCEQWAKAHAEAETLELWRFLPFFGNAIEIKINRQGITIYQGGY